MTSPPVDGWKLNGTPFEVVTSDGITLRGETRGTGPAVVFSHCWACDRSIWEPVTARLASRARVVVFDQRDHGRSDHSAMPVSVERMGLDILEIVDRLELERPIIAGHSMGGMAATAAALANRDRVAGLALVATTSHPGGWPPGGRRILQLLARVVGSDRMQRRLEGRFGRALVRASLGRRPHPEAVERTRATFAATDPAERRRYLRAIAAFDSSSQLHLIDAPTIVVAGALDTLLPLPHAHRLVAAIPGAELTRLAGAGHMLPLERADAVSDLIETLATTLAVDTTESTLT